MYNEGDILLFALSGRRTTSWVAFKRSFDTVYRKHTAIAGLEQGEKATALRWGFLRTMSCLGHIDLQYGSSGINVIASPPVLAALPSFGIRRAVLCGARSPETVQELRKAVARTGATTQRDTQSMANPYAPTRVEVQANSDNQIQDAAESLGISFASLPSARSIVEYSISLTTYCQRLTWTREEDLDWYREDFDTAYLRFRPPGASSTEPRFSRYQSPIDTLWRHRLWRAGEFADIDLDWGRYIILAMSSRQVLRYDRNSRMVFVPSGTPLPVLLARALGLSSGYPTEFKTFDSPLSPAKVRHYNVFRDVPPSIFRAVANKIEEPFA